MIRAKLGADVFFIISEGFNSELRGLLEDTASRFQCLTGIEVVLVEPQEALG